MGIMFIQHPIDGTLIVLRDTVAGVLNHPPLLATDADQYEVDIAAIRRTHGKTPHTR